MSEQDVSLLDRDYKYLKFSRSQPERRAYGFLPKATAYTALSVIVVTAFSATGLFKHRTFEKRVQIPVPQLTSQPATLEIAAWRNVSIKRGDTLAGLLSTFGTGAKEIHSIMSLGKAVHPLRRLQAGEHIDVRLGPDQKLQAISLALNDGERLQVERSGESFRASIEKSDLASRTAFAKGTITNSLFESGQKAGMNDNLIMQLVAVFGWDIDFAQDIRQGDRFSVLYEEFYAQGVKVRDGDIVAAEFVNRGKTYRAVRFTDRSGRNGYFTPEGYSMRKAFLRTPVRFSRISSGFSLGRFHPILNRIRAHRGVDYAAATGTPVRAAGNGRVSFRGQKSGYGNTIILEHGGHYSTLYAHMSGFGGHARPGARVRQGDIIGFVGQSGLATGPHLHYEFRVDGVHRNPLTVPLPKSEPIAAAEKTAFTQQMEPALAQLHFLERNTLTLAEADYN